MNLVDRPFNRCGPRIPFAIHCKGETRRLNYAHAQLSSCIPLKGYKGSEATAPVHRDEGVSQFPDSLPLSMLTVSVGLFNSVGTRSPVVNEERSVQSSPVLLKAR